MASIADSTAAIRESVSSTLPSNFLLVTQPGAISSVKASMPTSVMLHRLRIVFASLEFLVVPEPNRAAPESRKWPR